MPDLSGSEPSPAPLSQASLKQSQDSSKPPLTKYNLSPKQKDTEFSEISSISSGSVMSNSNASTKKIPFSWWFAKGKGSDAGDELPDDSHDDIYNEVYSDVHHEVYNSVEHEEVRRLQAQINMVMNGESVEPPKGMSRSELEQWWKVE